MHITIFNISDHMQMYWGSYKNNENTFKKKKNHHTDLQMILFICLNCIP